MTESASQTSPSSSPSSPSKSLALNHGLIRAIGRWSLAALIVNCIIGSGVFGLPSVLAGLIGRSSLLAVIIAAAAMGVIMVCVAEVASRFDVSGGPYLYAREAFGRFMGIQVGWLVWFVRVTACAANANLFVTYLGEFWPRSADPVPKVVILTLLIGILAAINFRGVRAGTHVSTIFTVAKLGSLALVAVAGAIYLIATHRVVLPGTNASAPYGWARAMVLLVFTYGGFETALLSAGEAKNPRRDMPFAMFTSLITCAVIYSLIQWVVLGVLPDPVHTQRPLADAARVVIGHGGALLVALGALCSVYGYLSGNMLGTPRVTYALAERGDFPSFFGAVHHRFRTPYVSIFVFALLVWALALYGSFAGNATLSAGSRLFYYGVLCAALPVLRKKQGTQALLQVPGGVLFAILGVLICAALLTQIEYNKSLILLIAIAVAFVNWLSVRHRQLV
jgi:basic amino acid/polyamine antiporter, APA family